MMYKKLISLFITIIAIVLAIIHMVWPNLAVDGITVTFFVLAVLPWLLPILKSLELPGGVKIELRDAMAATEKITTRIVAGKAKIKADSTLFGTGDVIYLEPITTLRHVAERNPNLAMVGFRIEIEKRLLHVAKSNQINDIRISISKLVRELQAREILSSKTASGLTELIALGNRAAHGVDVSPDAVEWVLDVGQTILDELDKLNRSNKTYFDEKNSKKAGE